MSYGVRWKAGPSDLLLFGAREETTRQRDRDTAQTPVRRRLLAWGKGGTRGQPGPAIVRGGAMCKGGW